MTTKHGNFPCIFALGLTLAMVPLGFDLVWAQTESQRPAQSRPAEPDQDPALRPQGRGTSRESGARQSSSRRSDRVRMREIVVTSPDGKVRCTLLPNAERLSYTVTMGDVSVVEASTLDLRVDGCDLSTGVSLGPVETYEIDETYPWHGAHKTATNRCHGARISFTNDLTFTEYVLEVRAFNDGVAYRHIIPGAADVVRVPEEDSHFVLPAGSTVWYHDLSGHYEAEYKQQDISEVKAGQWAGPPLTFQLPGEAGYGSITEAHQVNYAGMALECDGRRGWIIGLGHRHPLNWPFELRYGRENGKRLSKPASVTGTITTPWRVVIAGRDLNALVNSDILPNLCPPADPKYFPQGMDTPWCAPGVAVWDYVDRNYAPRSGSNQLEHMKSFSRMGGQLGARYHILEGFAYGWTDEQIKEFVDYSAQQGVRVLFWRHSNQLRTPEAQDEFFSRLHRLGVAGAKIDFFDHEARELVDLYETLIKKAAEYQCVVDFHGANKPSGMLRTYPNEMIREGVRGMESSGVKERARHETILRFARYLAGPTDYTTMHFGSRRGDSTWAHQVACLATFDSAMLTLAAHPRSILDNPAVDVIKSIPAVWEETLVLPESRIGELTIFARRKGEMWMLAVMRAAGPSKTIQVPLTFLGDGTYKAVLVRDDPDKDAAVRIENSTARRTETLAIQMRSGGGFVGLFTK